MGTALYDATLSLIIHMYIHYILYIHTYMHTYVRTRDAFLASSLDA